MLKLKSISREGIPRALERVERYRLLNEPEEAESICLDILQIEPENQPALIALLLSLTDQFDRKIPDASIQELLGRLQRRVRAGLLHGDHLREEGQGLSQAPFTGDGVGYELVARGYEMV